MIVRQHPLVSRSFDRTFEQLTRSLGEPSNGATFRAKWTDDSYVMSVDLPGVPSDAISLDVRGDVLVVAVASDEVTLNRQFRLNDALDPQKIKASYVNGRLSITVGKVDEPETRSVTIDFSAPEAIEATELSGNAQSSDEEDNGNSNDTTVTESSDAD